VTDPPRRAPGVTVTARSAAVPSVCASVASWCFGLFSERPGSAREGGGVGGGVGSRQGWVTEWVCGWVCVCVGGWMRCQTGHKPTSEHSWPRETEGRAPLDLDQTSFKARKRHWKMNNHIVMICCDNQGFFFSFFFLYFLREGDTLELLHPYRYTHIRMLSSRTVNMHRRASCFEIAKCDDEKEASFWNRGDCFKALSISMIFNKIFNYIFIFILHVNDYQ